MEISTFLKYVLIPLYKPVTNLKRFFQDEKRVLYGFTSLGVLGILYTLTVYLGYRNGFGAVFDPFLRIPAQEYYFWETFFCLPVFIIIAILFAGIVRLTAMLLGGKGSFEDIFALYCISIVFPMFLTMWIPESLLMIVFPSQRATDLGGFNNLPLWIDGLRQIAGVLWPLIITVMGIKISEKIGWGKSIITALVAFIPATAMMLIFIR